MPPGHAPFGYEVTFEHPLSYDVSEEKRNFALDFNWTKYVTVTS